MLAGNGVVLAEAWAELTELAEGADLPVVTSMGGKGAIAETHSRAVGLVGRYSRKVANDVLGEADLVLAVGCRLGGHGDEFVAAPPAPAPASCTSTPTRPCSARPTARS